ncbi:hypothetical protein BGZ68_005201 [Mortierella alpina]|nr:hypothetical protein BGZ68_005201 [Mortierella alpina]
MESSNERTSLVHVNSNGTGGINGLPHHRNYSQDRPTRTGPSQEESPRRDPRTLLAQVQRSAASFQAWAARILHAGEDSSKLSWVQNARVARTFAMIMNALLAVLSLILIGVEMVEMVVREPILDYLLPESEISLIVAGLTVVAGAFGFAVAYNLLVEEDTTHGSDSENGSYRQGNGSAGKASKTHVYKVTDVLMEKELNGAWTDGFRHRKRLISDFELRHHCCGYNSVADRPFPEDCDENEAYGFDLPLLALILTLSAIGIWKLKERKQEGPEFAEARTEAQAEAAATAPVMDGRAGAQYERPLLEDVTPHHERPLLEDVNPHHERTPLLVNVEAEPVRLAHDRSLI